jgi:hypothetical protein
METEDWRKNAPPILECEEGLNPPHLQRLNYNPNYYTPNEEELKIGDEIIVGTYVSNSDGSPNIRWTETKIIGLPLCDFYHPYVACKKLIEK